MIHIYKITDSHAFDTQAGFKIMASSIAQTCPTMSMGVRGGQQRVLQGGHKSLAVYYFSSKQRVSITPMNN